MSHRPPAIRQLDFKTSEEAALWLHRLEHEDSAETRAEFAVWIRSGAGNLEEFLFAQAVWKELDHLDRGLRADVDALSEASVINLHAARPRAAASATITSPAPPRPRRFAWIAIAACFVLAVVASLTWHSLWSDVYFTRPGDQKTVKLDDGSVVYMNTHSRIRVRYSEQGRTVQLLEGEALFSVEHDATRPFVVVTDSARIRAVGTRFNVYRSSDTTTRVAVVEGLVQVTSPAASNVSATTESARSSGEVGAPMTAATPATGSIRLAAGDEAEIDQGRISKSTAPNIERAVAWQARRLIFQGDSVAEVAAQFNRYNSTRILVEGEAIRTRRITGMFDADDFMPFIRFIARDPKVIVTMNDREILVRARDASDTIANFE